MPAKLKTKYEATQTFKGTKVALKLGSFDTLEEAERELDTVAMGYIVRVDRQVLVTKRPRK